MNEIIWLEHGGPGSGWFAEDGHVPGSLGGKKVKIKVKKEQKEPLEQASDQFKKVSSGMDSISTGIDKAYKALHNSKYKNVDRSKELESLTNQELRQVIERIKLNQEYNQLTMPSKSKGYDRTMAALAVLGSMATVTATGLSIAAGVKSLRKK